MTYAQRYADLSNAIQLLAEMRVQILKEHIAIEVDLGMAGRGFKFPDGSMVTADSTGRYEVHTP